LKSEASIGVIRLMFGNHAVVVPVTMATEHDNISNSTHDLAKK